MICLELFWCFLKVGLFSFGGGYASMPLIQEQVVSSHGWLSMGEFTDLVTISQMTPGPIAINSATFVGIKIAGIPGALAATTGCILPACVIVMLIAKLYLKYRSMNMLFRNFPVSAIPCFPGSPIEKGKIEQAVNNKPVIFRSVHGSPCLDKFTHGMIPRNQLIRCFYCGFSALAAADQLVSGHTGWGI